MFETEARGLQLLKNTLTFRIPEFVSQGEMEGQTFLLIEYIAPGPKKTNYATDFGHKLAQLHRHTAPVFGLDHDNYIGSLPQYNNRSTSAAEFYIENRLQPQLNLAAEKGYLFQKLDGFFNNLQQEIPNEPPALLHGDLWNGNCLTDANGTPCLIDPAVCYASREMDLAMMQLFGGFSQQVFEAYHEHFPLQTGLNNRLDIWQLYYLLVHLNLFGSSYFRRVNNILKKYS